MGKSILRFILIVSLLFIPLILIGILHLSRTSITPNDQFFIVQKGTVPIIDENNWTLIVSGQVQNNLTFDYDNLTGLNSKTIRATLECVEGYSGTAIWKGVPLNEIFEMTGVNESAYDVVFYAADNYSDSLTIEVASRDNILLAYQMNGEILPHEHGFPIRLVTPDHYGYKWVKWIVRIEIVDYDYIGFWEERGWNDQAMRTSLSSWITHAYLFAITFIFGGLSMISAYKFVPRSNLSKKLPDFITNRTHILFSLIFTILSLITFIFWSISTFNLRGSLFYSLHGIIGLVTMILLTISSVLRLFRIEAFKNRENSYLKISTAAFYSFSLSMLIGFLISIMGGLRLYQTFVF